MKNSYLTPSALQVYFLFYYDHFSLLTSFPSFAKKKKQLLLGGTVKEVEQLKELRKEKADVCKKIFYFFFLLLFYHAQFFSYIMLNFV
jgi:hypothetical protein